MILDYRCLYELNDGYLTFNHMTLDGIILSLSSEDPADGDSE